MKFFCFVCMLGKASLAKCLPYKLHVVENVANYAVGFCVWGEQFAVLLKPKSETCLHTGVCRRPGLTCKCTSHWIWEWEKNFDALLGSSCSVCSRVAKICHFYAIASFLPCLKHTIEICFSDWRYSIHSYSYLLAFKILMSVWSSLTMMQPLPIAYN